MSLVGFCSDYSITIKSGSHDCRKTPMLNILRSPLGEVESDVNVAWSRQGGRPINLGGKCVPSVNKKSFEK